MASLVIIVILVSLSLVSGDKDDMDEKILTDENTRLYRMLSQMHVSQSLVLSQLSHLQEDHADIIAENDVLRSTLEDMKRTLEDIRNNGVQVVDKENEYESGEGFDTQNSEESANPGVISTSLVTEDKHGFMGCFKDRRDDRVFDGYSSTSDTMDTQLCLNRCNERGSWFAATERGTNCYCGGLFDDYYRHGTSNNCNTPCGGRRTETCGGPLALQVYHLRYIKSLTFIGCYGDGDDRAMTGAVEISRSMSNKECVYICATKGFHYAGTEFGEECYCGNTYDKYGSVTNCDMRCKGDPEEYCGGFWALMVYETDI